MPAGRPKKPTHLKVVTGNPGKRPLSKAEPQAPRLVTLDPPGYLSTRAAETWHRLAPLLDRMGVLTTADEMALGELCEAFADVMEARASLANPVEVRDREGEWFVVAEAGAETYTTRGKDGYMIRPRPEKALIEAASRRFHALLGQFGMTPAARSKVAVAEPKQADPLDAYFG